VFLHYKKASIKVLISIINLKIILSNHRYLMIYLLIYKSLNFSIMPIINCSSAFELFYKDDIIKLLKDKFEDLRLRLGHGRRLYSTGTEPIYYLVFPVSDILEVKRQTKAWTAKLSHDNWNVVTLSMALTPLAFAFNDVLLRLF